MHVFVFVKSLSKWNNFFKRCKMKILEEIEFLTCGAARGRLYNSIV